MRKSVEIDHTLVDPLGCLSRVAREVHKEVISPRWQKEKEVEEDSMVPLIGGRTCHGMTAPTIQKAKAMTKEEEGATITLVQEHLESQMTVAHA